MGFNIFEVYIGLVAVVCTAAGVLIAARMNGSKPNDVEALSLTAREVEVFRLLSQGLSNVEIADRLFLSLSTVKTHVSTLFVKLEVKNRAQAQQKFSHFSRKP